MKEEELRLARLMDLASKAYQQNIYTFSNFLSPDMLAELEQHKKELAFVDYETSGGNPMCERQIIRFGSKAMFGYEGEWPITVICVEPLIEKFSDTLGHRDYLGAVMNLGIERDIVGDILTKDKKAYIFCLDKIADFILEGLTRIKHTSVKCSIVSADIDALAPVLEDRELIVPSPRFDAIIAALTKCSRSKVLELFSDRKVTLNGKLCERNSMTLKEHDVFSVRGYGKFVYEACKNETRKGKVYIQVKIYR